MQTKHAVTACNPSVGASQLQEAISQLVKEHDLPAECTHAALGEASHTQNGRCISHLNHVQKSEQHAS